LKYTECTTTDEVEVTVAVAVVVLVLVAVEVIVLVAVGVPVGVDGVTEGEPPVGVAVTVAVSVDEPPPPVGVEVAVQTVVTGVFVGFDGPTGLLFPPFLPPHEAMMKKKGVNNRDIINFFMALPPLGEHGFFGLFLRRTTETRVTKSLLELLYIILLLK
jgi:hypothetical protein